MSRLGHNATIACFATILVMPMLFGCGCNENKKKEDFIEVKVEQYHNITKITKDENTSGYRVTTATGDYYLPKGGKNEFIIHQTMPGEQMSAIKTIYKDRNSDKDSPTLKYRSQLFIPSEDVLPK
jgi:hypothetical protein